MHGARYESARLFFYISHAMRNKSVGFESTRVFMHGARLGKKKPTTTQAPGVREVGRCHAPVMDKAGDLFGKFTRQMQNGVCLDFALPAPKAKRRTLRGESTGIPSRSRAPKKLFTSTIFCGLSRTSGRRCGAVRSAVWSLPCASALANIRMSG